MIRMDLRERRLTLSLRQMVTYAEPPAMGCGFGYVLEHEHKREYRTAWDNSATAVYHFVEYPRPMETRPWIKSCAWQI